MNSKSNNPRRYRRCFRLLHREKSSYINKTYSYQCMMLFPRLPITLPPFVPTLMSYRWNDEDDCDLLRKKPSRNHHQPIRRRIPKRYSDIVGPSTTKIFFQQKHSTIREKQTLLPLSQPNHSVINIPRHHSLKPINEAVYCFDSNRKTKDCHQHHDSLAHRMQAAMSSELMHSLDRNFVFGDRKQSSNHSVMTRSHSFNICTSWNEKPKQNSSHHLIPRVKIIDFNKENIPIDEQIIIRTIQNDNDINEEPIADYDDPKPNIECELDDKSLTHSDLGASSSFIIPQTSTTNTEEQTSTPPMPPPLPNLNNNQKKITFRCRTIADKLSLDHKLILKDEKEINRSESLKISQQIPSKPHYYHISKDFKLRKISQTLTRSHSSYGSISHSNDHETELTTVCAKPSITDQQIQDCLSSSSPVTSTVLDNECEHRSSSSKIYSDYKKRASLTSIPTNNTVVSHSIIIHPMHTRIGLRSSTSSSSTNEKLTDMTLSGKQMNVCVINQLNEHLSTRFRKRQQESCSNKKNTDHLSYDQPPENMAANNNIQSNVYDEPNDIPIGKSTDSSSIPPPPPPPPPLPVGGFRPIIPSSNHSSNPQRTPTMTLPREVTNADIPPYSNGTSTISSNLSNTRILCELRENPLFTRAKQHLDIEPGSNGRRSGRRLIGSTSNLTNTESTTITNETVSYLRLHNCSKTNLNKSIEPTIPKKLETITMLPNELDAIMGKRTKSTNDINQIKSRPCTKSFTQTQCRKSELELIFQKRAQRSEQNLT